MPRSTSTLITSTSKFTELIDDDSSSPSSSYFTASPSSDFTMDDLLRTSIAETLSRGSQSPGNGPKSPSVSGSDSGSSRQNSADREDGGGKDKKEANRKKRGSWMWGAVTGKK